MDAAAGAHFVKVRLKALLREIIAWTPLNRVVTGALRAALPAAAQRSDRLARYARRAGVVEAPLPNGALLRMCSRGDDDIVGPLFWHGWAGHETETATVFFARAASARVTLDIGAHVGYFALLAAHANPAGRVYAFEPLDRVRERLERNVALNGTTNVTCVPLAVGSPSGTAEFFHGADPIPSSSGLSRAFMQTVVSRHELTSSLVEVVEIDAFVESHGVRGVDLIKVDTETTEGAVIRGMLGVLRRDRPEIVCEILGEGVAAEVEALLAPLGYEYFQLTDSGPQRREHIRPDPVWRNFIFRPGAGD